MLWWWHKVKNLNLPSPILYSELHKSPDQNGQGIYVLLHYPDTRKSVGLSFIANDKNNLHQKESAMNTRLQTDAWMYRLGIVLVWILVASLVGTLAMTLMKQPVPDLLFVLGSVAGSGLARLLIPSPLHQ